MHLFNTTTALAQHIGIDIAAPSVKDPSGGAASEADWGFRLRGPGRPRGSGGGWLLTFARDNGNDSTGSLIAYEIDDDDRKTGRCALIRHPWDADHDARELARTMKSDLWDSGEPDLNDVDTFIS